MFPDTNSSNSQHKRPSCSRGTWVDPSPFASLSPRSNFESLGPIWSNMVQWITDLMDLCHLTISYLWHLWHLWASDINMAAIAVPACHKEWSLDRGKLDDLNLIVNHGCLTHDMCDKAHVSPYEGCPIISKALVLAWHSRPNCNMLGSIAMATGKELMWKTLVFSAKILTIDYIRAPDFWIWIDSEHVYQLSIFSWHPHYCQIWRTQC